MHYNATRCNFANNSTVLQQVGQVYEKIIQASATLFCIAQQLIKGNHIMSKTHKYQSRHVQSIFDISTETVRQWSMTFEKYLSSNANPGRNRQRSYNDDDMKVFATVSRMKDEGKLFDDIALHLATGQRDDMPVNIEPSMVEIASSPEGLALFNVVQGLVERVAKLEARDKDDMQTEIERLRSSERDLLKTVGRLEARIDMLKEQQQDDEGDD